MMRRIGRRAGWVAMGLMLGGSTFALAAAGGTADDARDDAPGFAISEEVRTGPELPEAATVRSERITQQNGAEDPVNHGSYVSAAAHCEDVDDVENGVSFEAPEDCDTDGRAHGEYVSTVARSDAGKPSQAGQGSATQAEAGPPGE